VAYRRAANILRIEDRKDGPHTGDVDELLFKTDEEPALFRTLVDFEKRAGLGASYQSESWLGQIVHDLALLRAPIDAFFEKVTVNDPDPALRRNRLRLLSRIRDTMNRFADFSLIEG
jgi:glycyl-tRNA synthetase beta chain